MKRIFSWNSLKSLGVLVALFAGIQDLAAATLVVGSCKSGAFAKIADAINAAPAGAIVQVCPGTYSEQITINKSLTLQGITSSNGDRAILLQPAAGLWPNAVDLFGNAVAAQVLVSNAAGPVNISNLWVYYTGSLGFSGVLLAGIYYQNSPGTLNGLAVTGQSANGLGIGIFLEGGASSPTVTVENSHLDGFDYAGIDFETVNQPNTALNAKITNNSIVMILPTLNVTGIQFGAGTIATVTGNSMVGSGNSSQNTGMIIGTGATGSVSGNNIATVATGIDIYADGVSVTTNKLLDNGFGIALQQTSVAAVKSNVIMGSASSNGPSSPFTGVGINFGCHSDPNVLSNTVAFLAAGLINVPNGLSTSTNKVFNAMNVRMGSCP